MVTNNIICQVTSKETTNIWDVININISSYSSTGKDIPIIELRLFPSSTLATNVDQNVINFVLKLYRILDYDFPRS